MRLYKIILLTILLVFNYSTQALISIGYRYGTMGQGIEVKMMLCEGLYLRGACINSTNNYTIEEFKKIITHAPKILADKVNNYLNSIPSISTTSIPVMLDYHFFPRSGFKLSAGVVLFSNDSTLTIHDPITNTNSTKKFLPILPEATIGYDSALLATDFINFSIEYGSLFFVDKWSDTIPILSLGVKLSI